MLRLVKAALGSFRHSQGPYWVGTVRGLNANFDILTQSLASLFPT